MNMRKRVEKGYWTERFGQTLKGFVKMLVGSHRVVYPKIDRERPMLILANGPSLAITLAEESDVLTRYDKMAVNFAANTPQFANLKPEYYILADPHFFDNPTDSNVARLLENVRKVDWPMTLFVPFAALKRCPLKANDFLRIEGYNAIGVEGFDWFVDWAYSSRLAMPRPRNVLIPAIMTSIGLGYKTIYLAGADHSWTSTLTVDETNAVLPSQPHFYEEDPAEKERIRDVYRSIPLHSVLYSFYLAFRSYFQIERFAASRGITIYNATPGSFIDAFKRKSL